jgi:adenine-specific DNA-methyltransferase
VLDVEAQRRTIQDRLDKAKSAAERNRLGQFATPPKLAVEIARYTFSLWRERGRVETVSFLDPAIGSGSFYSALRQAFPPGSVAEACGVEIDPALAATAKMLWEASGLRMLPGDFTRLSPDRRYCLVLSNPPYVRHHHLDRADKQRLKTLIADRLGLKISGLAGLYAHFLLLCDAWMAPGGFAVWLIPSEFMDVNYGAAVKTYLTEHVKLLHVHRYCPADAQFSDALVTSAIVVFEKSPPMNHHQVCFSVGGSITNPASSAKISLAALRQARKWTRISPSQGSMPAMEEFLTLGHFFSIKRGMATGANSFFILTRAEAIRMGIPIGSLHPILPSSRHLLNPVIEADPDGYPRLETPLAIIDCDLPEELIEQWHPVFWRYLQQGKAAGIHSGYLASRRTPWYSQEKRATAPFLCTYMGRQGRRGNPFRFFWNKSKAVAANVYLMLYPKAEMKAALEAQPELYPAVFAHLQALTGEHLIRESRVYGGGLHKMEPKELANMPAGDLAHMIQ